MNVSTVHRSPALPRLSECGPVVPTRTIVAAKEPAQYTLLMRIVVGVTDNGWAGFLRDHRQITEVNFWQPSPSAFRALADGEPFLFKTKNPRMFRGLEMPGYSLVGGGFYQGYVQLRVSEAWTIWGQGNGCATEHELLERIQVYRRDKGDARDPDPRIGCITLRNVFFADPGAEAPQPPAWAANIVAYKTYDTSTPEEDPDTEYVLHAFQAMQSQARVDPEWESNLRSVDLYWQGPKFGAPVLTQPRLGQGRFRLEVDRAYQYHCAVTGSGTYPSLEAAHIRDYADEGGKHVVTNALLLRSDVHALYDRGYLGIDPDLRLRVSPQLRDNGWNGVEFYAQEAAGFRIRVPEDERQQPDREALEWHFVTKFRGD